MLRKSLVLLALATALAACGARSALHEGRDVQFVDTFDEAADATDTTIVRDVPIPTTCTTDVDCRGTPMTPVCDQASQQCVGCRVAPDSCPTAFFCDPAGLRCVPGCRTDADCPSGRCRADAHQCVECVIDSDCPNNIECRNFFCTPACGDNRDCTDGRLCCTRACVDQQEDPTNCGGCGVLCPRVANGTPGCTSASCVIDGCSPGFADCDGQLRTGCEVALAIDRANCGTCGRACAANETCSGGTCVGPCGPGGCTPGLTCCGATCANITSDPTNCGGCDRICPNPAHGTETCLASRCVLGACDVGFADCDGQFDNGCEADLRADGRNCGSCGNACAPGQACSGGVCQSACGPGGACPEETACCGMICVQISFDVNHCGRCNQRCPDVQNGTPVCTNRLCRIGGCDVGFEDCNGVPMDGCESSLGDDPRNCGGCGIVCAPGAMCSNGMCEGAGCGVGGPCPLGLSCCGSVCINPESDRSNCGTCGRACPSNQTCTNGSCEDLPCPANPCGMGESCCAGTCLDTQSDSQNCGGCRIACSAGQFCMSGACCTITDSGAGVCGAMVCPGNQTNCGGTCVDMETNPSHCGACFTECAAGRVCSGGSCVCSCPAGLSCCLDGCRDLGFDVNNCGACGAACPTGTTCSNGTCIPLGCRGGPACSANETCCPTGCADTTDDPLNCGACSLVCVSPPNANAVCSTRMCTYTCRPGFNDCDGQQGNGCESDVNTDFANCGSCGRTCNRGQRCSNGMCVALGCNGGPTCIPGQTCCSNGCTDVQNDSANCGMCGLACPPNSICQGGSCLPLGCGGGPLCPPGTDCCGTFCTNISSDPANCGGCSNACPAPPNAAPSCTNGACGFFCARGFQDCDGDPSSGCEVSVLTSQNNCGACGNVCVGGPCIMGSCAGGCNGGPACPMGSMCCSSGCANVQTDVANCGGCGIACAAGVRCVDGACEPPNEGAFFPRVNPTFLTPGVHNFTTITIPAGAVVFVAGTGPESGTLDLRATGLVQIDGRLDVSGGPGTQSIIASQNTQRGRAGTGGFTGEVKSAAYSTSICEFISGVPGINGPSFAGSSGTCRVLSNASCIDRNDMRALLWTSPIAQFGGGAGVFTGFRAYGSGGGGPAGGAPGALGAPFVGEEDCTGVTGGGGANAGLGGRAGFPEYDGVAGVLGQTQCDAVDPGVERAYVGGGGGGSIGRAAAMDLPVSTTFMAGSGGGGGSADYLNRPAFGGTSGGGGGGGALKISTTNAMVINGELLARGGDGGDAFIGTPAGANCDPQPGAAGGGGSGGLIFLRSPMLTVGASATVSVVGGRGGESSLFATGGAGGAGGIGRIRISATPAACMLSGTFEPPLLNGCNTMTPARPGRPFVGMYPN